MADDGFDFKVPPRREAKRFEPPPWEREAFEELERRRAEDEQAQALLDQARQAERAQPGPEAQEDAAAQAAADQAGPQVAEDVGSQAAGADPAEATPGTAAPERVPLEAAVPDGRVDQMLAELAAQEPREAEGLWVVALGSAIVVGAIGGVLIIWAMAALIGARKSGLTGFAGGFVLLVFGAGFVFGALWLAYRTLRQRGVL